MQRLIPSALLLLSSAAAFGQSAATDASAEPPELRRYSVELIVFAYAEDVATGSELFLPDIVELEQPVEPEPGEDPWPLEGPLPDDSLPGDGEPGAPGDDTPEADARDAAAEEPPLAAGVFPAPDGGFVNEAGERVNEAGQRIDEDGNVIEVDDLYATVLFAEDELTMLDTWDRLDRLDAYEPLLHVGWAQAVLPEDETEPLTVESFGAPVDGLEGTFTLYLSRFLHLVVDLELAAVRGEDALTSDEDEPRPLNYEETVARYGLAYDQRPGANIDEPAPGTGFGADTDVFDPRAEEDAPPVTITMVLPLKYSIRENRIVANGDVRYFDHPKFGVIARVNRVELPDDADGESVDDTDVLLPVVGGQ